MEHAGTPVAAGPPEPLDQSYQLDFDPNAGFDVERLELGLDGSYEEVEHILVAGTFDDGATLDVDPEHDVALQEAHTSFSDDDQTETTKAAEDADHNDEVDYQDEIGYEDDDLAITDFNVGSSATKPGGADDGLQSAASEVHAGNIEPVDKRTQDASTQENDSSWDQELDFEEQDASFYRPDKLVDVAEEQAAEEQAAEEETDGHVDENDLIVDDFDNWAGHEQSAVDQQDSEFGNALEDLSQFVPPVPRIEVLYDDSSYALVGAPGDDPDSYFLSEAKELDHPLSQFLSALRAVISDEISTADELVIRFDPLDLEFGERSNENFLNRSFREILDCHATLSQVRGVSAHPVIQLSVRRDAEEHFLELLGEAKLVKGVPHDAEDSEMSEDSDDVPADAAADDGHAEDAAFKGEALDDYQVVGEDIATDNVEDQNEPQLAVSGQNDVAGEPGISQSRTSAPQSPGVTAEAIQSEEHPDDIQPEAHYHESGEDEAGEQESWDEEAAEGDAALQPDAQTPVDISSEQTWVATGQQESYGSLQAEISTEMFDEQTYEPTEQQMSDESLQPAKLVARDNVPDPQQAESTPELSAEQAHEAGEKESDALPEIIVEKAAAPEDGGFEQEAYTNGKYPPLFDSASRISRIRKLPATISPLRGNEGASVFAGKKVYDPVPSAGAGWKQSSASQQPAAQALGSATNPEGEEVWEIDYSDDEHEPTPSNSPEAGASSAYLPQARCAVSIGAETNPTWIRPRFVDSFHTNMTESSGVSLTRSFDTDANQDAAQDEDFVLAFDEEPAASTICEEADVQDYTITYEASDVGHDAEGMPDANAAEAADESLSKNTDNGVDARTAAETSSIHTSTTINGDEIDYEEDNVAGDSLTQADDGVRQSAAAPCINNDEIDWENDEDGYEQQPVDDYVGAESEESKAAALTPPSIASKRSRTDETESLADETGKKTGRSIWGEHGEKYYAGC
ncbi:hypothetical protein N657DRAFT_672325 [Parathielavia appendiculata]|uniref:Uncharacterized protein n=1 Tax=Parathielavia appendiculata TaxID=2587402 RepID=A0AAN6Z427_9PEZI|nr:hypothetical protein N657DRAFT_672325 [Parathielavia appendiculata]